MNAPQKTTMNANLFSRLFDNLDNPARLAIEMLDGTRISYGDLIAQAGRIANVLVANGEHLDREARRIVEVVKQARKQVGVHDGFLGRIDTSFRWAVAALRPRNLAD